MAEPTDPSANKPTDGVENNANPVAPSNGNDDWKAKYEATQSELQKVTLERNMLRNQLTDKSSEYEKKLEAVTKEKEEVLSKFDGLQKEVDSSKKQTAIAAKKSEIFQEYPDQVRTLAEELGIDLTDPEDEEALKGFTAKLDKIKEHAPASDDITPPAPRKQPKVTSNNSNLETRDVHQKTESEEMAELEKRLENVTF